MPVRVRLTEKLVRAAEPRADDYQVFDEEVRGFALVIYPSGGRAFSLSYRINGRQRRLVIGRWPEWSVVAARERAKLLRREIDAGADPVAERQEARDAATVSDVINRYVREHVPTLSKRNGSDQISMLRNLVEPELGPRKAADITPHDINRLLTKIAEGRARPHKDRPKTKRRKPLAKPRPTPVRANRLGEVLRKMFNLAVKRWKILPENPAEAFFRNPENERESYLLLDQAGRLADALAGAEDQKRADAIRLLMIGGSRQGEVLGARKDQFNLDLLFWAKQSAHTKQRRIHRVPISPDFAAIVARRIAEVPADCPYLFPRDADGGDGSYRPMSDPRRFWTVIKAKAALPADFRKNDLRHTFASLLISGGSSLEMIGKLLGHTQHRTTQRYAHLFDSPLRAAVNEVADRVKPRLRVVGGNG